MASLVVLVLEVEEEMPESSTTNQPPPAQAQTRATIELVLTEFATQFTSALRDWFDSLGHYRQLQFVQLPEVSSALAVIHDQFLGDPSAVFEAARRDYLNMKCCSLKAKDLNFHYKRMSLLFYKLNGFNEPTLKHIFLAFLPEELQLDIQRQLTASNLVLDNISLGKIFQLAKTCLDKLCEQKQFFKELLKDKEPFRSACKKPYLQIKYSDQSQVIFHQQLLSLDTTVPIPSIKLQLLPSKFQRPVPAIGLIDTGAQRRSHEEYRQLLTQFYDIFQSHGIMLSAKKSTIATNNIEFLVFIIHKPYFQHPDTNLFWTQDQAYEWFTAPHPAVIDNEIQSNVHNYLCQLNHQTPPHKDIFHTSLGPQHDLIMIPTPSAISKPKSTGIIIKEEKPDYTDFLYQDLQDPWEEFLPLSQHLQQFPQPTMYEPGSSSQPSKVDKATQIPSPKSQSSPSKPRCRRDCLIHLAVVPTDRGPVLSLRILLYKGFSHRFKDPVHQKPYDDFLNGLAQRENFSFMASTSSSTPVTLSSTLSLPKSCTSHTANKIENLVEYSYIPESTQISESSYPLISPYQLYKRPSSFTRSIRTLISTRRPHPKEYIQSSHLDQCALQATSAEQYVTLEIPSELLSNWKREGYTHLHLGGIRLILTLHRRKGLPVTARLAMLDTRFKQYQDAVIGTVLTTLHAGSVLLTFYPNFNLSLQDPNLPTTPESPSSDPRLQNHALDFPTPEHHSDTLMVLVESDQIPTIIQILRQIPRHELIKLMPLEWISNYEQFHNNTAPIQTSESMFERRQDGTVRMTFKPPPSAPQEPPRLFFTYSSMITAVQTAQENLPITRFNSNGYPVYPAKQNGHFLWDVPGSGMCDPNCPCWDDWEEDDDYVTTRKKKPKKKKSPVSCHHCDPKPPQDPPPPPAPLPFYKKELKWIATHCKSETPSSIPLPTPPLACMMFSSTSSDYSSSFPPLEPHTDSQRNVVSKPFIPSAITSTGHLEPAKPFESVLNWQTQNARA
ncbi:hypothetical protein KPL70_003573 [Citrus sinensis]|nr:hypothetical protein KPL70_003573 [Citrus sinensis]